MTAAMVERETFSFGRGHYYDGSTPERRMVRCPDCGQFADATLGDHGGACVDSVQFASPRSALGIVRAFALRHARFSMNDLRQKLFAAGVAKSSYAPALQAAVRRGWIEAVGHEPSTDPGTKRHEIRVYRSLITPGDPNRAVR